MDSRLGEILEQRGLVDHDQLRSVIAAAPRTESSLSKTLVAANLIDEEQLATLLERELRRPRADLAVMRIPIEIVRLVPEALCRRHHLLAIALSGRELTVAMSDPTNLAASNEIRLTTGYTVRPTVAVVSAIDAALERLFARSSTPTRNGSTPSQAGPRPTGEDAPVVRLIDALLARAIEQRASDLHFEPYEDCLRVRYRVDGLLHEVMRPSASLKSAATSRLKVMASLDIAERRLPQDGRFRASTTAAHPIDFRISVLPTLFGEKVVLRVLDHGRIPLDLDRLGLPPAVLNSLRQALRRPNGMILVTGPTGSGKTTTLYAAMAAVNDVARNICTVEDPIELNLPGINQVQVNDDIGLSFATSLRALLRQDPDVIMIGEIRDRETAAIAVRAALTGHLVLTTLHTNDSAAAIARLLDLEVPPLLLASAANLIVGQRLVRRRCAACVSIQSGFRDAVGEPCRACSGSGYDGRIPVFEALPITAAVRAAIQRGASTTEIRRCAVEDGMLTLAQTAAKLIDDRLTDAAEVARAIDDDTH